ncbi:hypothetical protein AHF37_02663 [Paragonimus kellicotti]|nr:hypothetical protein AHF37_02663 [Paragonimus kellicotti]
MCNWSVPGQSHFDTGSDFENATMRELCKLTKIEGNGLLGLTNRTLKSLVKAFVDEAQQWAEMLPQCFVVYQSTVYSLTDLVDWTEPSGLQTPYIRRPPMLTTEYIVSIWDSLVRNHELARRRLNTARHRQEEYYDRKEHEASLLVGTNVYLHPHVPSPKIPAKATSWTETSLCRAGDQ